jgi:hypothetical protein
MYLDGLDADPDIPFRLQEEAGSAFAGQQDGPTIRQNVDAGTNVIDLGAMIAELEANPQARKRNLEGR